MKLASNTAKAIREFVGNYPVDRKFLENVVHLEESDLLEVDQWLRSKGGYKVGRLLRLQSRNDLDDLRKGPADVLWDFIEQQKDGGKGGKIFYS